MNHLDLKIVTMTESIMQELEDKGLITRLLPSKVCHRDNVNDGSGKGTPVYVGKQESGSHSLVHCTIAYKKFKAFGVHRDNEEFLLLGGKNEQDLLLLIALDKEEVFKDKFNKGILKENDFVCLKCIFNNPMLSFFVMHEGVAHGEMAKGSGRPATFYVTEGSLLGLDAYDIETRYKINLN